MKRLLFMLVAAFVSSAAFASGFAAIVQTANFLKIKKIIPLIKEYKDPEPLLVAISLKHDRKSSIVKMMLKADVDPNIADELGNTALMKAVQEDQPKIVAALLKANADPNIIDNLGNTPLAYASRSRKYRLVTDLIAAGADPNIPDNRGITPLANAVVAGDKKMIKILLAAGADPNIADKNNRTVLLKAIQKFSDHETIKMLLAAGADPNVTSEHGITILNRASLRGDKDLVAMLLKYGADVSIRDYRGWDALQVVEYLPHDKQTAGHLEVIELLRKAKYATKSQ